MGTNTGLPFLRSPFLQSVTKSGLLAPDDLISVLSVYDPEQIASAEPLQIATFLVRKKLLTKFQAMQLLSGRTNGFLLGRYKITEGLRQDRVGMVFLAEDTQSRETVVLKVLPTDRVTDDTVYRPFLQEVRAAIAVTHANVARVLDVDVWSGTHFVVCEHVQAPTLDKLVLERGPLPPNIAGQVIAQTAIALLHAHAKGLLHRDVKPANIALYPDGRVKLLDIGLTQLLDNPWAQVTKRINLKEYAEEIAHIPPEQAWGCELDVRSDIYSLGSTAYFLLTGENPFLGSAQELMTERQLRGIPKPSAICPEVPRELDKLVQKMGAKDQHERFQSAEELVTVLHPWLSIADWNALGLKVGPAKSERIRQPGPRKKASKASGFFSRLRTRISSLFRL